MKTLATDVAIIGAGTAGLYAQQVVNYRCRSRTSA